jgi:outer membrane lipoprotein-sorting protein
MRILRAAVGVLALVWTAAGGAEAGAPGFADILSAMEARLADTVDYQCRLETWSSNGEQVQEVVVAYAYRRPARIRMEVLEGPYAGSLLLYDRERDPHRVRVLAGNPVLAFLQRMLYGEFFAVDHRWVVDRRGGGIHQSHWPHFIAEHRHYLVAGRSRYLGEAMLDGRKTYGYRLVAASPVSPRAIQREDVWVDAVSFFPVQYRQYDASGKLLRRARISELRFNTGIDPAWFREFHPSAERGIAGSGPPEAPQ